MLPDRPGGARPTAYDGGRSVAESPGHCVLKVLVAASSPEVRSQVAAVLPCGEFALIGVRDGTAAIEIWRAQAPDVVLADVELPTINGFDLCRIIRQSSTTSIILFASTPNENEVARGFNCGADDFVTRPFTSVCLSLRIRAIFDRYQASRSRYPRRWSEGVRTTKLTIGALTLDPDLHQVSNGTTTIQLTPLEFRIVRVLAANPGVVIPVAGLSEQAWGYNAGNLSALYTRMTHLRRKLQSLGEKTTSIGVVRGRGYYLSRPPGPASSVVSTRGTCE